MTHRGMCDMDRGVFERARDGKLTFLKDSNSGDGVYLPWV